MEEEQYKVAKRKVKKKKGFYVHFAVYLSVGLFFLLMNLLTFEGDWWFFFPMLPWGVGLSIHYLVVFGLPGTDILTHEWENREVERELSRMRGQRHADNATRKKLDAPLTDRDELDLHEAPKEKDHAQNWDDEEFV